MAAGPLAKRQGAPPGRVPNGENRSTKPNRHAQLAGLLVSFWKSEMPRQFMRFMHPVRRSARLRRALGIALRLECWRVRLTMSAQTGMWEERIRAGTISET